MAKYKIVPRLKYSWLPWGEPYVTYDLIEAYIDTKYQAGWVEEFECERRLTTSADECKIRALAEKLNSAGE